MISKILRRKPRLYLLTALFTLGVWSGPAYACAPPCGCGQCKIIIEKNHQNIRDHTDVFGQDELEGESEFKEHRDWMVYTYFQKHILYAMMRMTSQLTAVGIQQVYVIGTLLDAKHQLETQRLFQQLKAEAHKDYQPSIGMCEIGTNVRSLAASERLSDLAQSTFAQRSMQRQLGSGDAAAVEGDTSDKKSRLDHFIATYCNKDNNGKGLYMLCYDSKAARSAMDLDVDYTRMLETALTLDVDFTPDGAPLTDDEEDIFALSSNLYGHDVLPKIDRNTLANDKNEYRPDAVPLYFDLRATAAKRSVALNSFAAIVGMRAKGDKWAKGEEDIAPYLKKLVVELGVPEDEVEDILGKNPSYFAQMEVLAKKIYQNPVFYTELYDKPANVDRKALALKAIGLMQDRDIYKSFLRSEAVMSVILEEMLMKQQTAITNELSAPEEGESSIE